MASHKNKAFGGEYSGKIGPIVMSRWMDIYTVRAKARKRNPNQPLSAKQLRQNEKFSIVKKFLHPARRVIEIGYQINKKKYMTRLNMATSFLMKNAIVEEGGKMYIDLPKVKFSKPIWLTQAAWNVKVIAEEGRKITISWEWNPYPEKCSLPDDRVIIIAYNRNNQRCMVAPAETLRKQLAYTYTALSNEAGHTYVHYMFLASSTGKLVSDTVYLGMVKVMP